MCWLSGILGVYKRAQNRKTEIAFGEAIEKNALLNLLIGEFSGLVGPSVSSVSRCMLRGIWSIAKDSMIFFDMLRRVYVNDFLQCFHASRLQNHH